MADVYYSMTTQGVEGTKMKKKVDETRIAEEIVKALPAGVVRACSAEQDAICYAVRGEGIKLRTVVFSRASLRRLLEDPQRAVKIEYLQRDLVASMTRRAEFRYPRLRFSIPSFRGAAAFRLPMASVI